MTFGGKSRTKAEDARFDKIKRGNCMACLQLDPPINVTGQGLVEVHHLAGKKRHDLTVGLCIWHHRNQLFPYDFDPTPAAMRARFGPALSEGSKPFHRAFGGNDALLQMQNDLLGEIA